tara:strand:+ start:2906 stop:3919 length:1014 start_codon:yes stop_codon:yes gene_type:complete
MSRARETLRLRDDDEARVAWSLGSDGALELAMRERDAADDESPRLFANCYSRAWLNRLVCRARGGASDVDGVKVIVGLLRDAASREGSSSARADALSLKDLERLRGGETRTTRDEDDAWYLVLTDISVRGARTHYPLPLERVPGGDSSARRARTWTPPKSTPARRKSKKMSTTRTPAEEGEPSRSSVEDRLREDLRDARAETRALRRNCEELVREREKARAERAETTAKMVELRAELKSAKERETNTRVRLRETEATLRSVQRIRRAGEHQSTRAPAVAGGRPEPVVANNQRDDDEENDANEVMLDEIDARLRSLQDFLTRTKARDESRRPSDSLID